MTVQPTPTPRNPIAPTTPRRITRRMTTALLQPQALPLFHAFRA